MRILGGREQAVLIALGAAVEVGGRHELGLEHADLPDAAVETYVRLAGGCERFAGRVGGACYRWLGKALAVLTDGEFEQTGCPELESAAARRACVAGARTIDEPLVTFS